MTTKTWRVFAEDFAAKLPPSPQFTVLRRGSSKCGRAFKGSLREERKRGQSKIS